MPTSLLDASRVRVSIFADAMERRDESILQRGDEHTVGDALGRGWDSCSAAAWSRSATARHSSNSVRVRWSGVTAWSGPVGSGGRPDVMSHQCPGWSR